MGFYSTYEELKQQSPTYMLHIDKIVFTVPMRNWNPEASFELLDSIFCFNSTYEELKQMDLKHKIAIRLSFYSTYEELKPWILHTNKRWHEFLQYLWGIETLKGE